MINTARLQAKAGHYQIAQSDAVTDRMLLDIASQFENQITRKITALMPDQIASRYSGDAQVLVTTKYDGEGVFVYFEAGAWVFAFNAPSGRVRAGLPALEALDARLKERGIKRALFRCELYLPSQPPPARRATISDVLRVSFGASADDLAKLKLAMLDIIMIDGRDLRHHEENFKETWELLGALFGSDTTAPFHRPEGAIVPESQVKAIFDQQVAAGCEGVVIRRLQRFDVAKVKPHLSIDAVVIGYVEAEFETGHGVASLLTALSYPSRQDGLTILHAFSRVGSGFSDSQRTELLAVLAPAMVDAPLAMTDSDGRPVNFVRPLHIVELHGEDLVPTSSRDRENRPQVFATDGASYSFRGLAPLPRLTFSTFNQLRPDKTLAAGGARIEQAAQLPAPPLPEPAAADAAKVLRREVYAKAEAVRKLVLLQQPNGSHLPYLIYWTDYSAKRKDPLKVDLSGAFTLDRAQAVSNRLIEENVTKGFLRIDPAAPADAQAATAPKPPKTGAESQASTDAPRKPRASKKRSS